MDTNNFANGDGIPLGFGMALAQNSHALDYFSSLSDSQRQTIIDGTHNIRSKQEMQRYVQQLADRNINFNNPSIFM
ncbi:MAG: hypothetical protein A2Y15_03810 [Clostridiales bacterium GWF2_36_10]|nr:MAG: hypothetical protein A2Y15_03810 [Clostridiales bacterium GWF2_36_10]HAN22091.1 hypothetical protein [Clostridiales bacterium]